MSADGKSVYVASQLSDSVAIFDRDPGPPPDGDGDGDGVPDSSDNCPTQAGPAASNGCPVSQPPAAKADRVLTLEAGKAKVRRGKRVRFGGHIDSPADKAGCERDQKIKLQRRRNASRQFKTFARVTSDHGGDYGLKLKLRRSYTYRARVGESAACAGAKSSTVKVRVKRTRRR